ncbi:MAG TPA: hypothetical protein DCF63_03355, partial [Planctomycetaceae bacterium]|nr:hypothetical protein [Planctomycetaceae bacterium]
MQKLTQPPARSEREQLPTSLQFTASGLLDLEAAADDSSPGALPRFRMVAYTGTPMRLSGWRYPVIIDLAGLGIPSQAR